MKYRCEDCEKWFDDKDMFAFKYENIVATTYNYYCKNCIKGREKVEK